MKKSVTMSDIAKRLKISNVTVSNALSDKDGVSEELREKIKQTAAEIGYKFTPGRKGDKQLKSENIGVIIPERYIGPYGSFYWALYNSIIQELMKLHCYCMLEIIKYDSEKELKTPNMITEGKISGLIIIGQVSSEYAAFISKNFSPYIFVDFYDKYIDADCIVTDSYYGMYRLTDYLISMGHREIGFIGSVHATQSIQDRYMGYVKAMNENALEVCAEWTLPDRDESGVYITIPLPEKMPTAFVCNCDEVAYIFMRQLKEAGYQIPEDISLVGYDNYVAHSMETPSITTFEISIVDMATTAAQTIVDKIRSKDSSPVRKMLIGKLILKESVKKLAD